MLYMKFLITESKLEGSVFKYLDNQDFIKVNENNYVYFINSIDDMYAQIKTDKNYGWCNVNVDLINEISTFFSLPTNYSRKLIGEWVKNTLQMKVSITASSNFSKSLLLKIPK